MKSKRILSALLAVIMIVSMLPINTLTAFAATSVDSYTDNQNIVYELYDNNTATVVDSDSAEGDVVIPETVTKDGTTYIVTAIAADAFKSCSVLTSVKIPDSVTVIGNNAFYNCTSLSGVEIGNDVKTIGNGAFSNTALTVVTIPDSVETIGNNAFDNCTSLSSVNIGSGVKTIGNSAFNNTALTAVTIPDSVETIGNNAFYHCQALSNVNIGSNVEAIGSNAFAYNGLTSVTIPDNVKSIGAYAFYYCESLLSVDIGDGVESIGECAFFYCPNIESVNIGSNVKIIGELAFSGTAITSVTIPANVADVGDGVFNNCSNLTSVNIENGIASIGKGMFKNTALTSVTIPYSVKNIADSAFYGCEDLDEVIIYYNGVQTAVGTDAFTGTPALTNNNISYVNIAHSHCVCGGNTDIGDHTAHTNVEFTPWNKTNAMPTEAGNYVLMNDVTLSSSWKPADGTVLCLNEHSLYVNVVNVLQNNLFTLCDCGDGKITAADNSNLDLIYLYAGSTFNMYGGTIDGGGCMRVVALVNAEFNMYNGTIKGGKATNEYGGGGGVRNLGTFTMYGGSITGNTSEISGGGIYNNGTFTMNGGSITDNQSAQNAGGGVYNSSYATFTMNGGTITNNTSKETGGAVHNEGIFIITGGEINGNNSTNSTGGGVWSAPAAPISISGNAVISNNTGKDGTNNLHLASDGTTDAKITVGTMGTNASVGVSVDDSHGMVISSGGKDYVANFFSDNGAYAVAVESDNLKLIEKIIPTIAFASGYNPSKTYDGQPIPNPTAADLEITGAEYSDVVFVWTAKEGSSLTDGKPVNAGEYTLTATIPATDDRAEANATRTYSIGKVLLYIGNTIPDIYWGQTVAPDSSVEQHLELPDYLAYGNYVITMVGHGNNYVQGNTHDHFNKIAIEGRNLIWRGSDTMVVGDDYSFTVELDSVNYTWTGEVEMDVIAHTHNYTYEANDNIITESCTCDHTATATIVQDYDGAAIYNRNEYKAKIVYSDNWVGENPAVLEYYKSSIAPENKVSECVNAGDYFAVLTVEGVTASRMVTIHQKEIGIDWTAPTNLVYDGNTKVPTATATGLVDGDSVIITVALTDSNDNVNVGSFTYTATAIDNTNYKLPTDVTSDSYIITQAEPTITPPTASRVRKGNALSTSTFTGGAAKGVDGTTDITGTFEWKDGTVVLNTNGTEQKTVVFTPDSTFTNYKACEFDIDVEVYTPSSGGGGTTRYTVKFETNGGNTITSKTVTRNSKLTAPDEPTQEGFIFGGWYTDKELTEEYNFESKVTKSFTLYAKWEIDKEQTQPVEPAEWENPFIDVNTDDWFYDVVKEAYLKGLIKGTSDNTFSPNGDITRGMFVTILYRAEGEPAVNKSIPFADVKADDYFANAVIWAQQNEIVKGISENEFAPNSSITREQMAAILYRYAEYKGYDVSVGEDTNILSYADFDKISEYAIPAIQWACGDKIIGGKGDGILDPLGTATRAEAAAVLVRFLEKI